MLRHHSSTPVEIATNIELISIRKPELSIRCMLNLLRMWCCGPANVIVPCLRFEAPSSRGLNTEWGDDLESGVVYVASIPQRGEFPDRGVGTTLNVS
jgi:hypothetical protein